MFILSGLILFFLLLSRNANNQTFVYDFSTGNEGWSGDFADYPVIDSVFYELEFIRTTLPSPLNTGKYALKISGNNHSDDLFMFIKRKISGLVPNTAYHLLISVDFASNAPTNAVGIGGAPGEGVTMKAGASIIEPIKVNTSEFYLMNIDKGNQVISGADMDTIGNIGVADTTTMFTLINRNNSTHLFTITTDANGEVWVCIGTDSGFEGTTTLYYNDILLTFNTVSGVDEINSSDKVIVYPVPASSIITIKTAGDLLPASYCITNQLGQIVSKGKLTTEKSSIDITEFSTGIYLIGIGEQKQQIFKVMKN